MKRRKFVKILAVSTAGVTLPIRHFEAMGVTQPVLKPGRYDYKQCSFLQTSNQKPTGT